MWPLRVMAAVLRHADVDQRRGRHQCFDRAWQLVGRRQLLDAWTFAMEDKTGTERSAVCFRARGLEFDPGWRTRQVCAREHRSPKGHARVGIDH
eukprot:6262786-Prymnesium_polylepis.2